MWIIAIAIIIAACIIADGKATSRGGGYQPRPGGKLGNPPTGGSAETRGNVQAPPPLPPGCPPPPAPSK